MFYDPFTKAEVGGDKEDVVAENFIPKIKDFCKAQENYTVCVVNANGAHRNFNFELNSKGNFSYAGAWNNVLILIRDKNWRIATPEESAKCKAKDKAEREAIMKERSDVHAIAQGLAQQIFVQTKAEEVAKTIAETRPAKPTK